LVNLAAGGENAPSKADVRVTSRRSSDVDLAKEQEEAEPDVDDQGPTPRRRHVDEDTNVQPLTTKLLQQNDRLKNLARQLIADRGLTVDEYLVCFR